MNSYLFDLHCSGNEYSNSHLKILISSQFNTLTNDLLLSRSHFFHSCITHQTAGVHAMEGMIFFDFEPSSHDVEEKINIFINARHFYTPIEFFSTSSTSSVSSSCLVVVVIFSGLSCRHFCVYFKPFFCYFYFLFLSGFFYAVVDRRRVSVNKFTFSLGTFFLSRRC